MGNWLETTFRKLHLDYHQPPWMERVADAFSIEEARSQALRFKSAGVEAVEFFAYDHYGHAFYPSEIAIVHPNLCADYTGLMSEALKEQGIKTILYLNALTSVHLDMLRPEWMRMSEDGTMPRGGWLHQDASHICISSGYMSEYFIPLLQEAIEWYQPDAVWIDSGSWLVEVPCSCANCRRLYATETGRELPQGPAPHPSKELDCPEWLNWRLWRRGQIATYIRELVVAVKSISPSTLVAENNLGKYYLGVPALKDGKGDRWLTPKELGVDWLSCDPVHFGANHEMILSREGRYQATTGLPFDYMNERFHGWGEWQMRAPTDWKLESATMMAVGARCFFADQPYPDGTLEPAVYDDLKEVFQFVQERERHTLGTAPQAEVAVLASLPSQLFGPTAGAEWGRDSWGSLPLSRKDRVDGVAQMLGEAGIPYLIYDEATLRERLDEQKLVIVADQCLMEDATIRALEQYAEAGGRLLVTGRSGLWNEWGERRSEDPFAALLGMRRDGELPAPLHYWKAGHDLPIERKYEDVKLQVWGTAMQTELVTASSLAVLFEPLDCVWRDGVKTKEHWQHYTTVGAAPPGASQAGTAVAEHRFGQGAVLYLSSDLFSLYHLEGHRLTREWLWRCLDRIYPVSVRKISVDKPLHVEVSLMEGQDSGDNGDNKSQTYVHLINYFAQKRPGYLIHNEQVPPVYQIGIKMRTMESPRRVVMEPEAVELDYTWDGEFVYTMVDELKLHTIILIEI